MPDPGGEFDQLRADLRWNLLFVPASVSAPLAAVASARPLAGRTARDMHKVIQNLAPILFLRASLLVFVGIGCLFATDQALSHGAQHFGHAAALAVMVWTPAQLVCLGTVAAVAKRSRWRDRAIPATAWPYKAVQVAPLLAALAAIAFAAAFH